MKSMSDAGASGATQGISFCALSLSLYWSAALLCSANNAALVGRGDLATPIALFFGLLAALIVSGAAPSILLSRLGGIATKAIALGGPLLYGVASLMLGDADSFAAHFALAAGCAATGASLGLTLACLGAYLSRFPEGKGASIACGAFLAGAAAFLALAPFVFAYGGSIVAGLALLAALTLMIAGGGPSLGRGAAPTEASGTLGPRSSLSLPMGFWPLFASLLLYSIVYGIAISLTLFLGAGMAQASPMGLSLLAPGLILLAISLRFDGSVDFRRFQWFLFAPGIFALLALPFGEGLLPLVCCGAIVMVFTFFDIASFILLADLAHDCAPPLAVKVLAWGRASNIAGMALGWALASIVFGSSPEGGGNAIVLLAFFAVVILVMLMTFSGGGASHPVPAPAPVEPRPDQSDFDERCEAVARRCGLSARETELFKMFARGRSTAYIAETLCLSPSTVKTHTYRIYKKLDVHSRQDLIDLVEGESHRL